MQSIILEILSQSLMVKETAIRANLERILKAGEQMANCIASGHKILIFGNGGSAADAQHIAAEFVNRFQIERPPLAAIALTTDSSVLTSIGNDYHFDQVFAKQVLALGQPHDIAVGISTSGNSPNVIQGMAAARERGLFCLGLSGAGGTLASLCDICLGVDSKNTARIQETHITISHILCELTERILFAHAF